MKIKTKNSTVQLETAVADNFDHDLRKKYGIPIKYKMLSYGQGRAEYTLGNNKKVKIDKRTWKKFTDEQDALFKKMKSEKTRTVNSAVKLTISPLEKFEDALQKVKFEDFKLTDWEDKRAYRGDISRFKKRVKQLKKRKGELYTFYQKYLSKDINKSAFKKEILRYVLFITDTALSCRGFSRDAAKKTSKTALANSATALYREAKSLAPKYKVPTVQQSYGRVPMAKITHIDVDKTVAYLARQAKKK